MMQTASALETAWEGWQNGALCRSSDYWHLDFFNEKSKFALSECAQVCAKCPVKSDCLAFAFENDERWGVWGGVLFDGRKPRTIPVPEEIRVGSRTRKSRHIPSPRSWKEITQD
jgi:hypothetical protein